jgi:hypothetical protein
MTQETEVLTAQFTSSAKPLFTATFEEWTTGDNWPMVEGAIRHLRDVLVPGLSVAYIRSKNLDRFPMKAQELGLQITFGTVAAGRSQFKASYWEGLYLYSLNVHNADLPRAMDALALLVDIAYYVLDHRQQEHSGKLPITYPKVMAAWTLVGPSLIATVESPLTGGFADTLF